MVPRVNCIIMAQNANKTPPGIESGTFFSKIPFVKRTAGPKQIIVLGSSDDLMRCLLKNPAGKIKQYGMFIPKDYTIWVLGINPDLPKGYTIEQMCDDFARVINEKIGPAAYPVLGISYAGLLAITFAGKYPELVQKLILVVSAHKNSASGIAFITDAIEKVKKGQYYETEMKAATLSRRPFFNLLMKVMIWSRRKTIVAQWNPPTTMINAYTHVLETVDDRKKYLPMIRAPTIIFGGDKDQFFTEDTFRETAQLIPNAQFKFFPNETHGVVMERNKEIKAGIAAFLAK
jgi:pimeloyl-ACP methyl ester carboxylesterase